LSTPCLQLKTIDEVSKNLGSPHQTLLDARGRPRYLGLQEPLDPIAGHIPDALNRPFTENFNEQGLFKSKSQLREEFLTLLNGKSASTVVHQCGSGVSAVPNIIAMQLAGLGESSLYAGSWSEWSRTPGMPISSPQP
jgi:thiosulfate/3-mercaptopyruvate sulfurtransferase